MEDVVQIPGYRERELALLLSAVIFESQPEDGYGVCIGTYMKSAIEALLEDGLLNGARATGKNAWKAHMEPLGQAGLVKITPGKVQSPTRYKLTEAGKEVLRVLFEFVPQYSRLEVAEYLGIAIDEKS